MFLSTRPRPRFQDTLALLAGVGVVLVTSCVTTSETPPAATPQRPTFSSNTQTTAEDTVEVEAGLYLDPGDSFALPVRVKAGLDDATEVYFEWPPYQAADVGGSTEPGIGDLLLGYRRRFREETDETPAMAMLVEAKIPTANEEKGLGTGETDLFAAGIGQKQIDDVNVVGFYRFGLLGEVASGGVDLQHGFAGVATVPLDQGLDLFAEGTFLWTPEQDDEQLYTTIGVAFSRTPAVVFDASILVGLTPDAPDFIFLIGLTQNFGHLLGPRAHNH